MLRTDSLCIAVGNFSISDYTTFLTTTAVCAPFGYLVGEASPLL